MQGLSLRYVFIFFCILATALIAPIASENSIANIVDYICHLSAVIQAKLALMEGQFPLRIMPVELDGLRYAYYQFSSPTTYTLTALIYKWITPNNPIIALIAVIWFGVTLGGIYMYRLAYWFVKSQPAAILAGVAYLYAPYYIIVVDRLGNLCETVALGLIPAVVYYNLQRFYKPNNQLILIILAVLWYLLMTVHLVTFLYTSLFTALLLLSITIRNKRHWPNLFRIGIAYILGCMLGMWYLAPIVIFQKFLALGVTYAHGGIMSQFHPTLSQLFSPVANVNEDLKLSALLAIHPSLGWPILIAVIIALYGLINKLSSGCKRSDYWLPSLLIVFAIGFLLVWAPFGIWKNIPEPLLAAQYSWRLLSQCIWLGALIFAWSVCWLFKNKLDMRHVVLGTFLIVVSVSGWFPEPDFTTFNLSDVMDNPTLLYNNNAYTIDFNNHTNFINTIDNVVLFPKHRLHLQQSYILPPSLINLAQSPRLIIQGEITSHNSMTELQVALNNKVINTQQFKPGKYTWEIPLFHAANKNDKYKLSFIQKDGKIRAPIPVDKMLLTGFFYTPNQLLNMDQTKPLCQQHGDITRCTIQANSQLKLIELPVLYYPDMLQVTLNKKPVKYQSILYKDNMITAIEPVVGKNIIDVRFVGLDWANWVSTGTWLLCLTMLIQLLYSQRRMLRIKRL